MTSRPRGRPAHPPGPSFLSYTPDGTKLVTVGLNNGIRVFHTGSDVEPTTIDNVQDFHTAVAAHNEFFVTGCEDGTVSKFSLETNALEEVLTRFSLPVRDIALSPDGKWAAIASDELAVKVVNTDDMTKILYLRDQPRPAKHVTFDKNGSTVAVSCSDGIVYFYSLQSDQPELIRKYDGLIKALETESEASSKIAWHPSGKAFAAPTATKDVQVVSRSDWAWQRAFKNAHTSDVSAFAWAPNGSLLVTTTIDRKLILWDSLTQKVLKEYDGLPNTILSMQWHPTRNTLSYTNNNGEVYIHTDFLSSEYAPRLTRPLLPPPFIHEPIHNARKSFADDRSDVSMREESADPIDDVLSLDGDDFVVDDDGLGYAETANVNGKRTNAHTYVNGTGKRPKMEQVWKPEIHKPFQPGSTPWRGDRRYLCLNLIGFVWTISQDTHHTVTVEFYDREQFRDFHFTDPWMYDKACLNEHGTLFSCDPSGSEPAQLYYRPHETWTNRTDWRVQLPAGESITAIALSHSYIVVSTSSNYIRIYTLYGLPFRIFRQKSSPAVTCAAWRDYVLTIGNGPVGAANKTQLVYTLENIKRDEVCQSEDVLALPPGAKLQSVFFSDKGDPCIYDSTGTLLVLLHWRSPGQARWVPLLDTHNLARLAQGRKDETYWPVAVALEKFHCIILKGGETQPYFPRPLLSEFDFDIPIAGTVASGGKHSRRRRRRGGRFANGDAGESSSSDSDDEDADVSAASAREAQALEQAFVRHSLLAALEADVVGGGGGAPTAAQRAGLARRENEADKALLQLLGRECREGEDRGMKALEIVGLMRDRSGKMLELAGKVAERYRREQLRDRIAEVAERRLVGLVDEDDEAV